MAKDHHEPVHQHLRMLLLEKSKLEGRDNAVIHYLAATNIVADLPPELLDRMMIHGRKGVLSQKLPELMPVIDHVFKYGWNLEAEPLRPILDAFQPAFTEVQRGTTLGYASNIGLESFDIPGMPQAQLDLLAQMLCVEGWLRVNRGETSHAVDAWVEVLIMGRDFMTDGARVHDHMIGLSLMEHAIPSLFRIIEGGLDRPALHELILRVKAIEVSSPPVTKTMDVEVSAFLRLGFEWLTTHLDGTKELLNKRSQIENQLRDFWSYFRTYLQKPFWQRDRNDHQEKMELLRASTHPLVFKDNLEDCDRHYWRVIAKLRQIQIAAALELHRTDKGRYAERLEELEPDYMDPMPINPFTGKSFRYRRPCGDQTGRPHFDVPDHE